MKRLLATFRPQAWHGDQAVTLGEIEFDATAEFLALPLERIQAFRQNDYDSDGLAENLPERREHAGPFEVDCEIDEWLDACGHEQGRKGLSQADLDALRSQFGVLVA